MHLTACCAAGMDETPRLGMTWPEGLTIRTYTFTPPNTDLARRLERNHRGRDLVDRGRTHGRQRTGWPAPTHPHDSSSARFIA